MMPYLGHSPPTVIIPSSSSPNTSHSRFTPPPSPRLGVFTSYNPSLSPKHHYNPYQSQLKSPTLMPCTIPIPVKGSQGGAGVGGSSPQEAIANGSPVKSVSPLGCSPGGDGGGGGGANTATGGMTGSLYSHFLTRTASIMGSGRSQSESSPPDSPRLPGCGSPLRVASPTPMSTLPAATPSGPSSASASSSTSSHHPFSSHLSFSLKHRNDSNNNSNNNRQCASTTTVTTTSIIIAATTTSSITNTATTTAVAMSAVRPPISVTNVSPYKYQLRAYLYPRHITTEHVVFSHRTKVAGRSLYFFSPATRGGLSKPVFTTRETLAHMMDPGQTEESEETDGGARFSSHLGNPGHARRRRSGDLMAGAVCTMKRVHLLDPACDLGISVWRGRGPREGLPVPHSPPTPLGPALLVEAVHQRDGVAVAAAVGGDVLYLLQARPDLEPRTTEICVQDAVIACVGEGVVWYHVRDYTRRKVTPLTRQPMSPKLPLTRRGIRNTLSFEAKTDDGDAV